MSLNLLHHLVVILTKQEKLKYNDVNALIQYDYKYCVGVIYVENLAQKGHSCYYNLVMFAQSYKLSTLTCASMVKEKVAGIFDT